MPLRLLAELKSARLPLTITDPQAIREVELLRAALLVQATFQKADENLPYSSVVVTDVTSTGYALLARMESRKKD